MLPGGPGVGAAVLPHRQAGAGHHLSGDVQGAHYGDLQKKDKTG